MVAHGNTPLATPHGSLVAARERIIVLREGQNAPAFTEIVRVLQTGSELIGPGTNFQNVYTVVVRDVSE